MLFSSQEIPEQTRSSVNRLSSRNRLPQSVMLTGGSAALREKCAPELAMAVNCKQPSNGQPCGKCPDCVKIKAGSHPDVIMVVPEKDRKSVSIKFVREQVIEKLYVAPNEAENKVYIFPDAGDLSAEIQNALLKSIEEPPEFDMFIFECDQREDMLPTVISRCAEFALGDTLTAKSKKNDEKITDIACGILNAMCKGTEFDLMLACAPMVKNRAVIQKTAIKIITVIRDAMAESSGTPLLSGCDNTALALSVKYNEKQLLKIKDEMDAIIGFADSNANENLLLSRFSSALSQI